MSTIDQQFVEYVVKALVSNPEKVVVKRTIDEKGVLLELTVDANDLGRVIGKHGVTAQSIRTLLRALGTKNDARYNLKIIDNSNSSSHHDTNRDESSKNHQEVDNKEPQDDHNESSKSDEIDRFEKTRQELAEFDDLDV